MKKAVLVFLCSCFVAVAFAQPAPGYFEHYSLLKSQDKVPPDFLLSSAEKYRRDREQVNANQKRGDRKTEDYFYKENSYFVDLIRYNGGILLNDTIGNYLNKIADKLLAGNALRKKISVYCLKSSAVNAFSTDQGLICVNMGLIARINNEAELAFVLAHEIIHFQRKHAINTYLKVNRDTKRNDAYENNITHYHMYSRLAEMEADSLGLNLLLAAGYDPSAALATLEMLSFAPYAYLQSPFPYEGFENKNFTIPSSLKLLKTAPNIPDDGDHPEATHPGIALRIEALTERVGIAERDSAAAAEAEKQYAFFKNSALFECAHLLNNEGDFQQAAYHCTELLAIYKNNVYLQCELARAFYGIVLQVDGHISAHRPASGEEQKLDQLLWGQSASATDVMLLEYAWRLHELQPGNKDILLYVYGIQCELSKSQGMLSGYFEKNDSLILLHAHEMQTNDTSAPGTQTSRELFGAWLSLHEDVRTKFSLEWCFSSPLFKDLYKSAEAYAAGNRKEHLAAISRIAGGETIPGVVASMPFTLCVRPGRRKEDVINFSKMEKTRRDLGSTIEKSGKALDHKITVIDASSLKDTSISLFNDMSLVNEWSSLRNILDDTTMPFLPFSITAIRHIETQFGASSLMNSGFIHTSENHFREPFYWITFFYFPALPQAFWLTFKPVYHNYLLVECYDLRTGNMQGNSLDVMNNQAYHRGMIGVHIYNNIRRLPAMQKNKK